ncbi:MAG: alkaline phosphatase [Rhodospirillales bacterium]|nr:alkaline phosphatase [Rhodospirillales bacterium]
MLRPFCQAASLLAALSAPLLLASSVQAQTIYPIDRAEMLAGSRFDLKVEFPARITADAVRVTVNGAPYERAFGKAGLFLEREDNRDQSALILRDVTVGKAGPVVVEASDGTHSARVTWDVYTTPAARAKNVILFIGDGMHVAHRDAARLLSKGIKEGKYFGNLAMEDMPNMALLSTSSTDSIITDSANSISAYLTGHKSAVNAIGVYADRTENTLDDPKVETLGEAARRVRNMAIGVVTNTEIEDATPAGMVAHTRSRRDYEPIVQMYFNDHPDVIMGGGSAYWIPKSRPGSKRTSNEDVVARFQKEGYAFASTDGEMKDAAPGAKKLLGLFHLGNMDGVLDRKFLKKGTVAQFPEQPDLPDMVRAALTVLAKNPNGFVLEVESGLIDKFQHKLDWERAVYDTIMLDNAVQVAKDFARNHPDTLILVTSDHTQAVGVVGTFDDAKPGTELRDKLGVYQEAGYPNYPAANEEGYPATLDVSRRLAFLTTVTPDYYETGRPHLDGPFEPVVNCATDEDKANKRDRWCANEQYKNEPGATLRTGLLPRRDPQGVHSMESVIVNGQGPGAELLHGHMHNTALFRVMATALGLGSPATH